MISLFKELFSLTKGSDACSLYYLTASFGSEKSRLSPHKQENRGSRTMQASVRCTRKDNEIV